MSSYYNTKIVNFRLLIQKWDLQQASSKITKLNNKPALNCAQLKNSHYAGSTSPLDGNGHLSNQPRPRAVITAPISETTTQLFKITTTLFFNPSLLPSPRARLVSIATGTKSYTGSMAKYFAYNLRVVFLSFL